MYSLGKSSPGLAGQRSTAIHRKQISFGLLMALVLSGDYLIRPANDRDSPNLHGTNKDDLDRCQSYLA